jgi:hypothetical protein
MQSALKVEHKPMSWPAYTHRFAEPKVAELDVALDVQQQVVRLYVPEGGGAARGTHTYISSQVFLRGGGASGTNCGTTSDPHRLSPLSPSIARHHQQTTTSMATNPTQQTPTCVCTCAGVCCQWPAKTVGHELQHSQSSPSADTALPFT